MVRLKFKNCGGDTIVKNKIIFMSLIVLLFIIFIPIGVDHLIIGNEFYSNISNSDWVQFLGSYIGSLVGALAGIIGIIMTIIFTKDQSRKEREFSLARDREERRLSIAPLFLIHADNKNKHEFDSKFIFYLDDRKSNTPFNVMLKITNSGLGNAIDFQLRFVSYNGKNLGQSFVADFFKKDSPIRVLVDLSIYLPVLPDDIDEHLDENPKEFIIPYSVPKKYYHSGGSTIDLEITYKDLMGNEYCQKLTMNIQTGFKKETGIDDHWVHIWPSIEVRAEKAKLVSK